MPENTPPTLFYHVTLSETVPEIERRGLVSDTPPNWFTRTGGEMPGTREHVYTFDNYPSALRWAGHMDWTQFNEHGSGGVSIIAIRPSPGWEPDPWIGPLGVPPGAQRRVEWVGPEDIIEAERVRKSSLMGLYRETGFINPFEDNPMPDHYGPRLRAYFKEYPWRREIFMGFEPTLQAALLEDAELLSRYDRAPIGIQFLDRTIRDFTPDSVSLRSQAAQRALGDYLNLTLGDSRDLRDRVWLYEGGLGAETQLSVRSFINKDRFSTPSTDYKLRLDSFRVPSNLINQGAGGKVLDTIFGLADRERLPVSGNPHAFAHASVPTGSPGDGSKALSELPDGKPSLYWIYERRGFDPETMQRPPQHWTPPDRQLSLEDVGGARGKAGWYRHELLLPAMRERAARKAVAAQEVDPSQAPPPPLTRPLPQQQELPFPKRAGKTILKLAGPIGAAGAMFLAGRDAYAISGADTPERRADLIIQALRDWGDPLGGAGVEVSPTTLGLMQEAGAGSDVVEPPEQRRERLAVEGAEEKAEQERQREWRTMDMDVEQMAPQERLEYARTKEQEQQPVTPRWTPRGYQSVLPTGDRYGPLPEMRSQAARRATDKAGDE